MAVGLENGTVILLKGDFTRDKSISARVVHESSDVVMNLGFRDDGNEVVLYIVTATQFLICHTLTKDVAVRVLWR